MHTALRSLAVSAVAALAVLFGITSSAHAATEVVKQRTRYYSLMLSADGRAVASHIFYPSLSTAVAEAYDGSTGCSGASSPAPGPRTPCW